MMVTKNVARRRTENTDTKAETKNTEKKKKIKGENEG